MNKRTTAGATLFLVDQDGVLWHETVAMDDEILELSWGLTQPYRLLSYDQDKEMLDARAICTGRSRTDTANFQLKPLWSFALHHGSMAFIERGLFWAQCDKGAASLVPDRDGNLVDSEGAWLGALTANLAVPVDVRRLLAAAAERHQYFERDGERLAAYRVDETKEATFTVVRIFAAELTDGRWAPTSGEYQAAATDYLLEATRIAAGYPDLRAVETVIAVDVENTHGSKTLAATEALARALALSEASLTGSPITRIVVVGDSATDDPKMNLPVREWMLARRAAGLPCESLYIHVGPDPLAFSSDEIMEVVETRTAGLVYDAGAKWFFRAELAARSLVDFD